MASIAIRSVRKAYGALEVLHGVSIDIADGEFVILVGPSGCGKSTLLRMIAGLESVTGGDIAIGDVVVNDLPPKVRDIAMVFQSYALYPHMTVAQNMGFSLMLAKRSKAEIDEKVSLAANILGLQPLLNRRPAQLSGGQRQRVAMGRAIVRDPAVFLFDEPLSNLDAQLRVQMRAEIKALHQRLRTTTVYVTHDQVEAMTMADRIVVMHDGRVEQMGAPLELFDRPANLFVARFIGSPSMNLIDGHIEAESGAVMFQSAGVSLALDARFTPHTGKGVVLGFRPQHLILLPEGDASGLAAQVSIVEPTGSETLLHLTAGVEGQVLLAEFRERLHVEPGETVSLGIDPSRIHVFDKASGQRIE